MMSYHIFVTQDVLSILKSYNGEEGLEKPSMQLVDGGNIALIVDNNSYFGEKGVEKPSRQLSDARNVEVIFNNKMQQYFYVFPTKVLR